MKKHDYITRLSAKTGKKWSKKLLVVREDLHDRMLEESGKAGVPLYEAYRIASESWLKSLEAAGKLAGETVTGQEERVLKVVLDLYRNRKKHPAKDAWFGLLDVLGKL